MSGYGDRYSDPLDSALGEEQSSTPIPREPAYFAGLNTEQREAVEAVDGPVLVLAGAGTGKTRVLTTRLAHILATRRAWPGQMLCVTFTNKAAREMKERIGALIGGVVEGMQWLGTFHSIGAKMLRRHAELAGLKSNFTILDTDDQLRLMKDRKSTRLNSSHTEIYTLSLHDALPIYLPFHRRQDAAPPCRAGGAEIQFHHSGHRRPAAADERSEEHTSELQSHRDLHSFPTRRSSDLPSIPSAPRCCAAMPSWRG